MDKEIQVKIFEVLEQLGTKLGVASEHLWKVLVRQQYVDGVELILMGAFSAAGTWGFYKLIRFGLAKDDEDFVLCGIIGGAVTASLAAICLINAPGNFINPEYYAFRELMTLVLGNTK